MKYFKLLSFVCLGLVISCGDDEEPMTNTCESNDLTYTNDIAAIINSSCATATSCHGEGSNVFEMHDYAAASVAVSFGRIVGTINHQENFSPMPPSGVKLDDCTIEKITQWIADGAPE